MVANEIALATAAEQLREKHGGHWGEHPEHPLEDWRSEVANDDTRLGYWEWVAGRIDNGERDEEG